MSTNAETAIDDATAAQLAAEWAQGELPGLTALAANGSIYGTELRDEIRSAWDEVSALPGEFDEPEARLSDLSALAGYVHTHGNRGPVFGWVPAG